MSGTPDPPPLALPRDVPLQGDDSRVGQHLGAYCLDALIGAGGMGVVYRARDTRLGRDVAIKILSG